MQVGSSQLDSAKTVARRDIIVRSFIMVGIKKLICEIAFGSFHASNLRKMGNISKSSALKSIQSQLFKYIVPTFDKFTLQQSFLNSCDFQGRYLEKTEKMRTFAAHFSAIQKKSGRSRIPSSYPLKRKIFKPVSNEWSQ